MGGILSCLRLGCAQGLVIAVGAEGWIGGSDEKRNEIGWTEYSVVGERAPDDVKKRKKSQS